MVIWYYMAYWDIMTYNDTQNLDEKIWKVGNLGLTWKKLFVPSWKHVSTFLGGCYNDKWCCFSREKWTVQLAHDGCIFWTGKLILILSCHVRFPSGPGGYFFGFQSQPVTGTVGVLGLCRVHVSMGLEPSSGARGGAELSSNQAASLSSAWLAWLGAASTDWYSTLFNSKA